MVQATNQQPSAPGPSQDQFQQAPAVPQYYPQQTQAPQAYQAASPFQAQSGQPLAQPQQGWQPQGFQENSAISRLEALLTSQPTAPMYQNSPFPYQPQAPQAQPLFHQQHQGYLPSGMPAQYQGYQPTYNNTQQSSNQYSGLTPADLGLAASIKSPAALASLAEIPSVEIQASKSTLNALAVEYEEQIFELSGMIKAMAPSVRDAHNLKSLWTPEGFAALSDLFLDQLTTIPGAYMHFLNNGFGQVANAFAQPDRERAAQQQAYEQQVYAQQQQAQGGALPIAAVAQAIRQQDGQKNYWADGQSPLDERTDLRPGFPGIPAPSSGQSAAGQIDLEGMNPSQLYMAIDDISARGGWSGTTFVSE